MTAAGSQNGHDSPMKTDTQWDGRHSGSATPYSAHMSPSHGLSTKSVAFELLFPESPQYKARLPMRVQIHYHDTTASIVETVKNFYGLYNAHGHNRAISFEDRQGNTLIACYKNLSDGMTVYVRVTDEAPSTYDRQSYHSASPVHAQYLAGEQYQMPPPPPAQALTYGQPPTRPASGASERGSASPSRGRQIGAVSTTASGVSKARSRSGYKSRGSSTHGSFPDIHSDGLTGYSSGDGAPNSVSSRTKSEQLGNTEISLDNIVEGGRRKRAKFESSVSDSFLNFKIVWNLNPFAQWLIGWFYRSFHFSHLRRCQPRPPIPPSPPHEEQSITDHHIHLRIRVSILLLIQHMSCIPRKALAMDSGSQTCTQHLPTAIANVEENHHRDTPMALHQLVIALAYSPRLIQPSEAVSPRRTKTLHFNS